MPERREISAKSSENSFNATSPNPITVAARVIRIIFRNNCLLGEYKFLAFKTIAKIAAFNQAEIDVAIARPAWAKYCIKIKFNIRFITTEPAAICTGVVVSCLAKKLG